jgi:hypothetical protein
MDKDDIMALEGVALSRATAEKLGWTEIQVMIETVPKVRGWITSSDSLASYFAGIPPAGTGPERIPDYATDLTACWRDVLPVLVSAGWQMESLGVNISIGNATGIAIVPISEGPEATATMLSRALLLI